MAENNMMASGINRMVAMIAGAVLVLVGLLGFVNDPVLGLFETNLLHNIVHLLSGAVLLGAAFAGADRERNSRMALLTLGVVYVLVTLLGFIAPGFTGDLLGDDPANNVGMMPDNILHLLLAITFIAVPLVTRDRVNRPMAGTPRM